MDHETEGQEGDNETLQVSERHLPFFRFVSSLYYGSCLYVRSLHGACGTIISFLCLQVEPSSRPRRGRSGRAARPSKLQSPVKAEMMEERLQALKEEVARGKGEIRRLEERVPKLGEDVARGKVEMRRWKERVQVLEEEMAKGKLEIKKGKVERRLIKSIILHSVYYGTKGVRQNN